MYFQTQPKLVLGIDPGIERLGWALVEKTKEGFERIDSGVKKTPKEHPTSKRLFEIHQFLDNLIKKEKPDAVSTEKLFFASNVKTALTIGEVRGVILSVAEMHSLGIREFTPLQLKMAICGYGKAAKQEVASMLRFSIKLPKKRLLDDETDAIALALASLFYKSYP